MKIQMKVGVSGNRGDGTEWPPVGGEIEVSDEEGRELVANGMAVEAGKGKGKAVDPVELDDHKVEPQPAIQARPEVVPEPNDRVDEVAGDRVVKRADGSVDSDPADDAVSPGNTATGPVADDEPKASPLTTKNGPTADAKRGPGRPRKS